MDQVVRSGWFMDTFLKVELTEFPDELDIGHERKREVKVWVTGQQRC